MDHPLRTISYIADIGNIVVLMARRRMPRSNSQENVEASHPSQDGKRQYKMICHVFESEDVRLASPTFLWVTGLATEWPGYQNPNQSGSSHITHIY